MTPPSNLAKRYAQAFYRVIRDDRTDEAFRDYEAFVAFYFGYQGLQEVLQHPVIRLEKKQELINKVFGHTASNTVTAFLHLLLKRNRLKLLPMITEEIETLYRAHHGIQGIHVTSAVPLLPRERERLRTVLTRTYGTVEMREKVDPGIKGGLVIWFGNSVIDSSIRARLQRMQEIMLRVDEEWLSRQTTGKPPQSPSGPGVTA